MILKLSKALKIEDTEPTVEDTMLLLETMVHNDVIYLYDQKTNDFIYLFAKHGYSGELQLFIDSVKHNAGSLWDKH